MSQFSFEAIEKSVNALAKKINAPVDLLPTYGYSKDFAHPHIEIDTSDQLHYVIIERGEELERKRSRDMDDLLYWIFSGVTFSMACTYELKNRIGGRDCRRMIFEKQEILLGILNTSWQQREKNDHLDILVHYPFNDQS